MRLLAAFLLVVLSGLSNSAIGQQTSSNTVSSDQTDTTAYRTLFRRVILYKNLADQTEAAHSPKPHLRRILPERFALSDADSASLERLALAYQGEIGPIHQQAETVIKTFHARFPLGIIPHGVDHSPPPELKEIQQQEDAVALRYRDLLRNSMIEEDFQKLHTKVLQSFATPITR